MLTIKAAGSILAFLASATLVSAHGHVHSWTVNGKEEAGFFPSYPPALGPTAMRPNASPGRGASDYHTAIVACGDTSPGTGVLTWDVDAGSTVTANWGDWPISHMASCDGVVADTLDWFKISQEGYDGAAKLWATEKLSANPTWSFEIPADLAPGPYLVRHELIALHSGTKEVYPTCWQANLIGTGTAVPTDTVKFPDAYKINTDFETWDVNTDLDNSAFVPPGPAVYAGGGGGAPAPAPVPASSSAAPPPASSSAAAPAVSSAAAPVSSSAAAPALSSAPAAASSSAAAPISSSVDVPAESSAVVPVPSSPASSAAPVVPSASSAAPAPEVTAPVITPPVDDSDECTEDESPEGECPGEEEEEAPPVATGTVVTPPAAATSVISPPVETSPVITPPTDTPEVVTPPTQGGSLGGPAPAITKEGDKFIVNGASYNFEGDAKYASCMSQMNKCKNWANGLPNAEVGPAFALCDSQAATCHTGSKKRDVIQRYSKRALASF